MAARFNWSSFASSPSYRHRSHRWKPIVIAASHGFLSSSTSRAYTAGSTGPVANGRPRSSHPTARRQPAQSGPRSTNGARSSNHAIASPKAPSGRTRRFTCGPRDWAYPSDRNWPVTCKTGSAVSPAWCRIELRPRFFFPAPPKFGPLDTYVRRQTTTSPDFSSPLYRS
jgi:hypothetical protein